MINVKYPALLQLFSCYFHQDWREEFGSPDIAVDAFVKSEPLQFVNDALRELERITNSVHSDAEVLDILNELGCYYDPTANGKSALSWLQGIRDRFSTLGPDSNG